MLCNYLYLVCTTNFVLASAPVAQRPIYLIKADHLPIQNSIMRTEDGEDPSEASIRAAFKCSNKRRRKVTHATKKCAAVSTAFGLLGSTTRGRERRRFGSSS